MTLSNKKLEQLWQNYLRLSEQGAPREQISAAFDEYEQAHREDWDRKREKP